MSDGYRSFTFNRKPLAELPRLYVFFVFVCVYVCVFVCVFVRERESVRVCVCMCMCMCKYVFREGERVCVCACVCVYACVRARAYVANTLRIKSFIYIVD